MFETTRFSIQDTCLNTTSTFKTTVVTILTAKKESDLKLTNLNLKDIRVGKSSGFVCFVEKFQFYMWFKKWWSQL